MDVEEDVEWEGSDEQWAGSDEEGPVSMMNVVCDSSTYSVHERRACRDLLLSLLKAAAH